MDRVAAVHILPKHVFDGLDAQAINQHQWFRAPKPGLGPFTFREWVAGSHITVERNPNYYKSGQPYLDTIVFKIVPDANTLLNQLETGEVDSRWRLTNEHVDIVKGFPNVAFVSQPSVTPWLVWMNRTRTPFNDKAVRVALAHGFDKEGIAKQLLKGYVRPAWQAISPLSWAHNPNVVKHTYDPAKAKQVLDTAGWVRVGWYPRQGRRQAQLRADEYRGGAGAGADPLVHPAPVEGDRGRREDEAGRRRHPLRTGAAEAPVRHGVLVHRPHGRPGRLQPATCRRSSKPTSNFPGYANPEVDKLIQTPARTVNRETRKDALFKIQDQVATDEVALYLAWLANHTVMNKRIYGYKPAPAYSEFWNADEWSASS